MLEKLTNISKTGVLRYDRASIFPDHVTRSSRRCARRRLSHWSVWTSRNEFGCGFGRLPRCGDRVADRRNWRRQRCAYSRGANISAALGSKLSAALASAVRELWNRLYFPLPGGVLVPVFALVRCIVADCFRDYASGGAGGYRAWEHCG